MGRRLSVLLPLAGALLALALVIGFPQLGGVLAPARAQVVLTLTVSASPNPLNTGTGNFSTVTVTATDPFSQPVSGVQIQLTSSRPTEDTITAVNATTNASGQATFQVSSRTVGTSTLT
ncbi:MAG: Ig-like domain-containing protein, partial [Anaerolineae bacterium]|nr:Ig-like domain-containing protein [Anaerolineae bacterium]